MLCVDTDDYTDGEFYVITTIVEQGINDILLKFDIHLENKELKQLVNSGAAEYVIHIECSDTSFRTVIRTSSNTETYRIMNSKVNGTVSLLAMVVSKMDITGYSNSSLNEDYEGIQVSFPKASILAYENMDAIQVAKNYEELSEKDSIFSIVKRMRLDKNEHNKIMFSLDNDRIKITVDDDIYSAYVKYQKNRYMQPIMRSLLVIPALTYVLEMLREEENFEAYESYYWFIKLQKFFRANGKDFIEDVIWGDDMISDIVQDILQLPIGNAILSIADMLGEDE